MPEAAPPTRARIPVIDISAYRRGDADGIAAVARAIDDACRSVGFLIITGHGVDPALIERTRRVAFEFFALPHDVKMAYKIPPDRYRGYTSPGSESLAASYGQDTPPDLKESFNMGPVDVPDDEYHSEARAGAFFAPNWWPAEVPDIEAVWSDYYRAMERLSADLMRLFALALDLPEHTFDDKVDRHITNMSFIHYPPLDAAPRPGQLRGGAHTDFGSLTLVHRDRAPGGLQVLVGGEWIDAPHEDDSFVVNIGDLMAEWTNDRWVSTVHRVGLPTELHDAMSDRLSLVFFHQPNYDARIEVLPSCCSEDDPPRYAPTTSGEHIARKLAAMRRPELGGPVEEVTHA